MSTPRCEQGSGHPVFCWHCSKQLQRARGEGLNLFYFRTVIDQDGVPHRVHSDCVELVVGDGVVAAKIGENP